MVRLLLDRGGAVDAPDMDANTPLIAACEKGHLYVAELLHMMALLLALQPVNEATSPSPG